MSNVIAFHNIQDERQKYEFINKPVHINLPTGESIQFPCICLYKKDDMSPVAYPCLERWLFRLNETRLMASTTMRKKAAALCNFANYILHETTVDYIHELTVQDIRNFLSVYRIKDNGESRTAQSWEEGVAAIYEFLKTYYDYNKEALDFTYSGNDLVSTNIVKDTQSRRKIVAKQYNYLSVKAPSQKSKKNRLLLYDYLELFLFECVKYDPMIVLGVALQAYSGIREGEVVNLTYDRFIMRYSGFGRIGDITLDLMEAAPFISERKHKKSSFGEIKRFRKQTVYPDFNDMVLKYFNSHSAHIEALGYKPDGESPIFLNEWGKPMSVHTYKERVKKIFYEHFLPALKTVADTQGTWAADAPFIEAYESEYPGAHMFRHWFTMYLVEKTPLTTDEISKWRGDSNRDSMLTYVHINADMLEAYRNISHNYQRSVLEEILK